MKWYEFSQNNSGGDFVEDENLAKFVFIQAKNEKESIKKAKEIGIYFNGVRNGTDCGCCGDRWSSPDELEFPYRYGTLSINEAMGAAKRFGVNFDKTTWRYMGTHEPDPNQFDLIFESIEQYAKYMCGNYRFMQYGARIHFNGGTILKIGGEE